MRPAVDVVILSWNRKDMILETIANIRAQVDVEPKIWVVDQGSDDETLAALRPLAADGSISLLELGYNTGVAGGRNRGTVLGQADIIVSIDNDAVFESEHALAYAVQCFQDDPRLGVMSFRIKNYTPGKTILVVGRMLARFSRAKRSDFTATRFVGCGHAIRRSAWNQTRQYDERLFFYWEELDLSYQLIAQQYHIVYDPQVVVLHKVSPEKRTNWREKRYYYLVRNAIYLDYKYYRSTRSAFKLAAGYLLKGFYNRLYRQSVRAIWDAAGMIRTLPDDIPPLNEHARAYIAEHDLRYRGSTWDRFRREVLTSLPE